MAGARNIGAQNRASIGVSTPSIPKKTNGSTGTMSTGGKSYSITATPLVSGQAKIDAVKSAGFNIETIGTKKYGVSATPITTLTGQAKIDTIKNAGYGIKNIGGRTMLIGATPVTPTIVSSHNISNPNYDSSGRLISSLPTKPSITLTIPSSPTAVYDRGRGGVTTSDNKFFPTTNANWTPSGYNVQTTKTLTASTPAPMLLSSLSQNIGVTSLRPTIENERRIKQYQSQTVTNPQSRRPTPFEELVANINTPTTTLKPSTIEFMSNFKLPTTISQPSVEPKKSYYTTAETTSSMMKDFKLPTTISQPSVVPKSTPMTLLEAEIKNKAWLINQNKQPTIENQNRNLQLRIDMMNLRTQQYLNDAKNPLNINEERKIALANDRNQLAAELQMDYGVDANNVLYQLYNTKNNKNVITLDEQKKLQVERTPNELQQTYTYSTPQSSGINYLPKRLSASELADYKKNLNIEQMSQRTSEDLGIGMKQNYDITQKNYASATERATAGNLGSFTAIPESMFFGALGAVAGAGLFVHSLVTKPVETTVGTVKSLPEMPGRMGSLLYTNPLGGGATLATEALLAKGAGKFVGKFTPYRLDYESFELRQLNPELAPNYPVGVEADFPTIVRQLAIKNIKTGNIVKRIVSTVSEDQQLPGVTGRTAWTTTSNIINELKNMPVGTEIKPAGILMSDALIENLANVGTQTRRVVSDSSGISYSPSTSLTNTRMIKALRLMETFVKSTEKVSGPVRNLPLTTELMNAQETKAHIDVAKKYGGTIVGSYGRGALLKEITKLAGDIDIHYNGLFGGIREKLAVRELVNRLNKESGLYNYRETPGTPGSIERSVTGGKWRKISESKSSRSVTPKGLDAPSKFLGVDKEGNPIKSNEGVKIAGLQEQKTSTLQGVGRARMTDERILDVTPTAKRLKDIQSSIEILETGVERGNRGYTQADVNLFKEMYADQLKLLKDSEKLGTKKVLADYGTGYVTALDKMMKITPESSVKTIGRSIENPLAFITRTTGVSPKTVNTGGEKSYAFLNRETGTTNNYVSPKTAVKTNIPTNSSPWTWNPNKQTFSKKTNVRSPIYIVEKSFSSPISPFKFSPYTSPSSGSPSGGSPSGGSPSGGSPSGGSPSGGSPTGSSYGGSPRSISISLSSPKSSISTYYSSASSASSSSSSSSSSSTSNFFNEGTGTPSFGGIPGGGEGQGTKKKRAKSWTVDNKIRDFATEFLQSNKVLNTPNKFSFGGMTSFPNKYGGTGNELDNIMTKKSLNFRGNVKWM